MKSLRQVISIIVSIAKAKSNAVKSKTSTIKTRLMLFKLLHDKKMLMTVISQKVHAVKANEKIEDNTKGIVPYKREEEEEEEEGYSYIINPELNIREEDYDEICEGTESVVDFTSSHWEEPESSFENEIDKAADVFIRRFHMQMMIQKQDSFKRYQEMLENSV